MPSWLSTVQLEENIFEAKTMQRIERVSSVFSKSIQPIET